MLTVLFLDSVQYREPNIIGHIGQTCGTMCFYCWKARMKYSHSANEITRRLIFPSTLLNKMKRVFFLNFEFINLNALILLIWCVDFNRQDQFFKCGNTVGNIYRKLPTTVVFCSCGISWHFAWIK